MCGGQDAIAAERVVAEAQPRNGKFACPFTPRGRPCNADEALGVTSK